MSSPSGANPYQVVEHKNPNADKLFAMLAGAKNSPLQLMLSDASKQFQLQKAAREGNPEAAKKFWGQTPSTEMWSALRGDTRTYAPWSGTNPTVRSSDTKSAAKGGLMSLRGYAPGGTAETPEAKFKRLSDLQGSGKKLTAEQKTFIKNYNATIAAGGVPATGNNGKAANKPLTAEQVKFVSDMGKLSSQGKELTQAQKDRLNKIETNTGRDVSPFATTGTTAPGNKQVISAMESLKNYDQNVSDAKQIEDAKGGYTPAEGLGIKPGIGFNANFDNPDLNADYLKGDPTGQYYGVTNPFYRQAIDTMKTAKSPEEYAQASQMYNQAAAGLQGLANYSPQQVSAQQASAQNAAAQQASAAQMGNIADVTAERAAAERAAASRMGNIADVNAQQVDLGKYNIDASKMGKAKDVEAQQLERYQMGDTAPVTTQDLTAYQMEGPGSWTDEGVSSKYMSPYMQGVIDISKREAERDYLKQMNALNAKAMSAGAFGGSRQALERSEAQRNYNQQLQDIQVKGLQQAYESGRSQYGQELSLSQQAALNNLQSKLSTQSQSSQQELQAMLSNQNIDYQTKLQNLQAMLGVQSQEAQQMLNASLANQQSENLYNQTNAQLAQQAALANQGYGAQGALANQQAALQAALANQQTQFGVGSLNANLEQQAALQNAQLGTQTNLANQQAALQAALANQQTQFGVGSLNANLANQVNLQNANLGTQAAMQNAQLGTQTSWQNAQNALNASLANQAAGLQANAQGIGAYGAMGNMASGLGSIGNNIANWNQQYLQNLGAMGNTWQTGMQSDIDRNIANAGLLYGPGQLGNAINAGGKVPTGGSGLQTTQTPQV